MNKNILTAIVILFMMYCSSSFVFANNSPSFDKNLQNNTIFIPAGINCNAVLSKEINLKNIVSGQTIDVILTENFKYKNNIIASIGSVISGSFVLKNTKNNSYKIKYTTIRTPYNNVIPINATTELKSSNENEIIPSNSVINLYFNQPITLIAQ